MLKSALRASLGAFLALATVVAATPALAGKVYEDVPRSVSRTQPWIIYLHGAYVEREGSDSTYQFNEILATLAKRGFNVIGEERDGDLITNEAEDVADKVKELIKKGISPRKITVAGHSKGGMVALWASTILKDSQIKYAVLAGCGKKGHRAYRRYRNFQSKQKGNAQGKFMVMWDFNDSQAADCDNAFDGTRIKPDNQRLVTGRGHEEFYVPRDTWIDPLVRFAR